MPAAPRRDGMQRGTARQRLAPATAGYNCGLRMRAAAKVIGGTEVAASSLTAGNRFLLGTRRLCT